MLQSSTIIPIRSSLLTREAPMTVRLRLVAPMLLLAAALVFTLPNRSGEALEA